MPVPDIISVFYFREKSSLLKWKNFPLAAASWESKINITQDILDAYDSPEVPSCQIEDANTSLILAFERILCGQGNKSAPFSVPFKLYVFCVLTKDIPAEPAAIRGYHSYTKAAIDKFMLGEGWDYFVNQHGVGRKFSFPILLKPTLTISNDRGWINEGNATFPHRKINDSCLCESS